MHPSALSRLSPERLLRSSLPLLALAFGVVPACKCSPDAPGATGAVASTSASAAVAAPSASASGDEEEVRPVYPPLKGPPAPLAVKLCEVVQSTGERRKNECCGRPIVKSGFEKECERVVSGALALGTVTVDDARIATCAKALEETFGDCDWVRPIGSPTLPPACSTLIAGKLAERARCRSHLECQEGLFCDGLSPTRVGTCTKGRTSGGCFGGTDSLAVLAHQRPELHHSPCTGVCVGRLCSAPLAVGAACKTSTECGKESHCEAGACKAGAPADCSSCAFGQVCVGGACKAPKKAGETCAKDEECRGTCVKAPGGTTGTCAMRCDSPPPVAK